MTDQSPPKPSSAFDEEDKPLDPAVERVRRKMMRLMAISVGIMMVGLMAVLFAIVYKISARSEQPVNARDRFETILELPKGARIASQSLSGDQLTLLVEHADGKQTIILFDTIKRDVVGRVQVGTE